MKIIFGSTCFPTLRQYTVHNILFALNLFFFFEKKRLKTLCTRHLKIGRKSFLYIGCFFFLPLCFLCLVKRKLSQNLISVKCTYIYLGPDVLCFWVYCVGKRYLRSLNIYSYSQVSHNNNN